MKQREVIVKNLEQIFFHPVHEIIMDNATAFRSATMREFLKKRNVSPYYRAAYRASVNGNVERHHRTIKSMAKKSNISPVEAVYWWINALSRYESSDNVLRVLPELCAS